ncbi:camk family protein kinase [Grosmannia clavigera kw1407]|uniref:Camk family protein kinase n=1 Tax=Grosmannia clavigera (strain kw1407 / UAMH 11150) TaxID=655863 RepID=F0XR73_GROCL|nr:camk family protein kinase [Grosmannia clavigera kw1407]EFW99803.1 camk family protein kinase [Grosmannia clavigera kw1407]
MPDPGLIATLHVAGPHESRKTAERTLMANQNRLPFISSCGSNGSSKMSGLFQAARLQLRFDSLRRNRAGFVFGSSTDCDIVLPRGLAPYFCILAFDLQRRLILRELQGASLSVRYGDKAGHPLSGAVWLLSGHRFTEKYTPLVIRLSETLSFRIEVAAHHIDSTVYQTSVDRFPDHYDAAWNLVPDPGFTHDDNPPPGPASVLLDDRQLGRGGQARVDRVWDARTGIYYAAKIPLRDSCWRRLKIEASLLARIDHEHVIKLLYLSPSPNRRLILEYAAGGTVAKLAADKAISCDESLAVVGQCLLYMPPEAREAPDVREGSQYTWAVDIWSLGVVALELTHRLPAYRPRYPRRLVRDLGEKKKNRHCPLLDFLSTAMVVMDPRNRCSADVCYDVFHHGSLCCCPPVLATATTEPPKQELAPEQGPTETTEPPSWVRETLVHADYTEDVHTSPCYGVADVCYSRDGYAVQAVYSYFPGLTESAYSEQPGQAAMPTAFDC